MRRLALLTVIMSVGSSACPESEPRSAEPPADIWSPTPQIEVNSTPNVEVDYVGFGHQVRLEARLLSPQRPGEVQWRWRQVAGRPLELVDTERATLVLTTHTLDELTPPRPGPIRTLALTPTTAGHYRFVVEAHLGEASAEATVTVRAGPSHPGWPRTPQKLESYLDAGLEQDRYDWVISFSPPRSDPIIEDATHRRPRLKLTRPGRYEVTERVSGRSLLVHSGPWMGTEQCGRIECHPVEQRGWAATKMATVARRGLEGDLRSDYNPDCLRCHTVGFDPAVDNGGFDDVARELDWSFPDRLQPGNYDALPHKLADRANVGCEACHGPGRFYTSYSAEVCARCHEAPPDYVNPVEWRRAPMSQIRDDVTERPECRRCHTAQGLLDELYGHQPVELTAAVEDVQYELQAITCGVCHDAHAGEAERLIRSEGPLWGQEPDVDWGTGMICLACHHGGAQWAHEAGPLMRAFVPRVLNKATYVDELWSRRLAPHSPQGDMVRGRAGHALPGPGPLEASPPHLTVPGGCVGCHVRPRPPEGDERRGLVGGHTFAMFSGEGDERVENTTACAPCHGELSSLNREVRHDYDGNGRREGIYDEVAGLLELAHQAADAAIARSGLSAGQQRAASFGEFDGRIVLVDAQRQPLGDASRPMTFPEDQERLYRAIFNIMLITKDRSNGVHNPVWTVRLLQRTILRLNPTEVPRWYWR